MPIALAMRAQRAVPNQTEETMSNAKRVFFGRKVLSAWDEKRFHLDCPDDQSPAEFYSILCDSDDPYYFEEYDAHIVADKFGGTVGE
jgi:hypothetical protein